MLFQDRQPKIRRNRWSEHSAWLALLVLAIGLAGCAGSLDFIKKRLPPPQATEEGYLFLFSSPSAQVVQLCGSWEENNW